MAVTVGQLIDRCNKTYGIEIIAGANGRKNIVEWVHIMETSNVSSFLRGQEIVFTTGLMNKGNWLLEFVMQLHKAGASALVINIGPYIPNVDKCVIDYCNRVDFPLFTLPWKTRMVDVTRDFCAVISQNINDDNYTSIAFKNLIFHKGDTPHQILAMEGAGFDMEADGYIICIGKDNEKMSDREFIVAEQCARIIEDNYCSFEYNGCIIALLYKYSKGSAENLCASIHTKFREREIGVKIGVSNQLKKLDKMCKGFEYAVAAYELAVKKKRSYMFYEDMDIYKIFIELSDKNVLKEYYKSVLGELEKYDEEHGSGYIDFLKTYIENNASPQLVSEKQFIHRNTVVNYLKKIDAITGLNMYELEDKYKCMTALAIKEYL